MSNINKDGYGSPYMRVSYNGAPIPGNIVKWVLVDSEKKDDLLEFTIESQDPELPDHAAFQESAELIVIRGYIGGIQGAKRKFYVRDLEPNYNEKNLSLSVKCTDKPSIARQTKVGSYTTHSNKTPKKIVKDLIEVGELNFKFKDGYRDGDKGPLVPFKPRTYLGTFDPATLPKLPPSSQEPDRIAIFKKGFNKIKASYAQGNKSDMRAIKELVDGASEVPTVVTGHDDTLYIYPRDLSQPPFRIFKWKSDTDLLTFIPETKTRAARSADSHVKYIFPDEATKQVMMGTKTRRDAGNIALNDSIKITTNEEGQVIFPDEAFWASIRNPDVDTDFDELENTGPQVSGTNPFKPVNNNQTFNKILSPGYIVANPKDSTKANIFFPGKDRSNESEYYLNKSKNWTNEVDETRNKFNSTLIVKKEIVIDGTEDAPNEASKKLEEDTFELNEGSATIICDPRITSGIILSFENVSVKYSGKYYVLETRETSDARGYLMELIISRNAQGPVEVPSNNIVPAIDAGVPVNKNSQQTVSMEDEPTVEIPIKESTKITKDFLGI